jgi:hypothetical protein
VTSPIQIVRSSVAVLYNSSFGIMIFSLSQLSIPHCCTFSISA